MAGKARQSEARPGHIYKEKKGDEMSYSYGKSSQGWKEDKKEELFQKLVELIKDRNPDNKCFWLKTPWIQKNDSVTIRKITHLNSKNREKLKDKADAIYREVMGLDNH